MLGEQERRDAWKEARQKVMAERHVQTQAALAAGLDAPAFAPLPAALPQNLSGDPSEFGKPATIIKRYELEPLTQPQNVEPVVSPEAVFAAAEQGKLSKATDKAKRIIAAQAPQPKVVGYASGRHPKVVKEVIELASTGAGTPAARQTGEQPRPNETADAFFLRVQETADVA